MALQMLVGLNVIDDDSYSSYREAIAPILDGVGGGFVYDFMVSKVLKSSTVEPINRVFTMSFPDEETMNSFFSNDEYRQIKERYFEDAVTATTIMARFEG